jgi:hypothetical protein
MGESKRKRPKQEEVLWKCAGVQTMGGRIGIRRDGNRAATTQGQLAYFIEYLTLTEWWSRWEQECPLSYKSPNAAGKAEVLGTWLLSALSGHKRYAHVTSRRCEETG